MSLFVKVASTGDIAPGASKLVEAGDQRIALFNLDGSYCAIGDTCTHRGGPLSEGWVEGETVTCPWHGARFNLRTGAVVSPPAPQGVPCYAVRVQGSDIEVEI